MEHKNYHSYRSLPTKEKMKKIKQAKQKQADRKPNPQGSHRFTETWWYLFETYQGQNKIKLCTYRESPPEGVPTRAILVMFHGLNSYLGHGAHIAKEYAAAGILVVGFDHRGFGLSQGIPGYVESLQGHLYDARMFVQSMKKIYPDLPFFAMGLSMGGMTSYYLSLKNKDLFRGVILMAPALRNMIGGFLVGVVNTLGTLLPNSTKLIKPPKGQATRNPQVTDDVFQDEGSYKDRPSLKTLQMIIKTMDAAPATYKDYEANFVIIQGGLDKLVNPEGAFELFDQCKSKDKTILFYEEMWHDVWHQDEIFDIVDKTKKWILDRLPRPEQQ